SFSGLLSGEQQSGVRGAETQKEDHRQYPCVLHSLLQRLDTDDVSVVVSIPGGYGVGRIIDPGPPVERERLGKYVFDPPVGLGIEPDDAAAALRSRPNFAVLFRLGFIERDKRRGRLPFPDLMGLPFEFCDWPASSAVPAVSFGIHCASCGVRMAGLGLHFRAFSGTKVGPNDAVKVRLPGGSADEEIPVLADVV